MRALRFAAAILLSVFLSNGWAAEPKVNGFFGRYHYVMILPENYYARPAFADAQQLVELVLFFPKGTSPAVLEQEMAGKGPEQRYRDYGLVRLEVWPKDHPDFGGDVDLGVMKQAIPKSLTARGDVFTIQDLALRLPAFEIVHTSPTSMVQVFIEGKDVIYMFTAGRDDPAFQGMLNNLQEL